MKKLIKKIAVAAAGMTAIFGGNNTFALDIVSDPGHTQATAAGWAAQAASWAEQIAEMKHQFDQLQATYNSLNGSRGMADLINNPELRQYLPANFQDILAGGYGNWEAIREAAKVFGVDETTLDAASAAAKLFNAKASHGAIYRATMEDGYNRASQRFADLQVLLDKINNAPDAKDIADLQARIQAEQAMLQNENIKLATLSQLVQAQQELATQQSVEIGMASTRSPNGIQRF
ncbi:P-type DNA transfer protein VirB5 [Methylobacter sp.]|uniref:P-type DNA transfer protein VirB5 n=1 Tax=Methylobacter sp. TaxID=2051955 RepID=UPI003DA1E204